MSVNPSLFLEQGKIVGESPVTPKELPKVSLNQRLLLRAMINSYSLDGAVAQKAGQEAVNYSVTPGEAKTLNFKEPTLVEYRRLIENFRNEPKNACGAIRQNLINIARDGKLSEAERHDRLQRYLKAYLELIPLLDHTAFPPDGPSLVHEGVPGYIPDGLSDMGSDPTVDAKLRDREKIRVNKTESYKKAFPVLLKALWNLRNSNADPSSDPVKKYLVEYVLASAHNEMPYDYKNFAVLPRANSVPIHEFVGSSAPVSVCRHIAMEAQLRMQALGIECRLLKCHMDGVPHVANVVRMNSRWYLGDPTNPEVNPHDSTPRPFLQPIILTDSPNQTWNIDRYRRKSDGSISREKTEYTSRNNMYYRVLTNP